MKQQTPKRRFLRSTGYTLLELMVVMTVAVLVATMGYMGFEQMMVRTRLQGDAVGISNALQRARALAVRHSSIVVAQPTTTPSDELEFFFDDNDNQIWDAGEEEAQPALTLTAARRPEGSVYFWSVDTDTPDSAAAMDGLTVRAGLPSVVVIEMDGSVRDTGGIRLGMGPIPRNEAPATDFEHNFMEVRIVTAATGRTELRKFIPGDDPPYQPKMKLPDGSPNWKFYH